MVVHAHREAHLTFLVDGPESDMPVDGCHGPLTQETVVACSPWRPHAFQPGSPTEPSTFLVLYVSPIWFSDLDTEINLGMKFGSHLFYRTQKIKGYVTKLVNLLFVEERSDLVEGYIYELTRECFDESRRRVDEDGNVTLAMTPVPDFRIRRSIEMMKEMVGHTLVIEEIAAASGVSRPHFFKLFKDYTGLTPNLYLNTLRVEAALSRLCDQSQTIAGISDDLGFSSQASFTRFFSSNVGVTPSEYRHVTAV
ncbi:MAG: AraC family transcriptional regulator [Paracoccaceae bacterium]|nr:AraC family transcriptional regulator [Paracoccaceae bacterium]